MPIMATKPNNAGNSSYTILIPCLNESSTIEKAVLQADKYAHKYISRKYEILIADNGSTDGTLDILKSLKKSIQTLKVINVPTKGYGAALHHGIVAAKNPYVIFADADLSYDFKEIGKFTSLKEEYDLVLGSRLKGGMEKGAMPIMNRYIGTPILTQLIKVIYRLNHSDCNSGMRMVKKEFYKKLKMGHSGMEWASELLIRTALHKGKFSEIPIFFRKDQRNHKPHLKRWGDGWRHLKVIVLLRPSVLIIISLILILIGIVSSYFSLFTTISMSLLAEFFILSYLSAKKLISAADQRTNYVVQILDKFPLVFIGVLVNIIGFALIFIISDNHLFTKYIILSQIVMYNLWLFFIETVQSFLANRLE